MSGHYQMKLEFSITLFPLSSIPAYNITCAYTFTKDEGFIHVHHQHYTEHKDKDKDKDKDLFTGPQEFVVGYSKAPEQPQSSARPICHSHAMTRTGPEPATIHIAA